VLWFFLLACGGPDTPSVDDLQSELLKAEQTIEELRARLDAQQRRIENVSRLDQVMEAAHTLVEARCSTAPASVGPQAEVYGMDESGWAEIAGEPEAILTQGRWIPHGSPQQPTGWRLVRISRGGLLDSCGLRSADVLLSINGKSMVEDGGPNAAMESVTKKGTARLELLRNRKPFSLSIERRVR
jgi:type II secretory pathway component PulC